MKTIITDKAPAAAGPYSQAVVHEGIVYVSGQIPIDPSTGTMPEGIEEQTRQTMSNLRNVIEAAGSSMDDVLRVSVYIVDMSLFPLMNSVYSEFFKVDPPARSCVEVSALPKGALVEIDAIAHL